MWVRVVPDLQGLDDSCIAAVLDQRTGALRQGFQISPQALTVDVHDVLPSAYFLAINATPNTPTALTAIKK